MDLPPPYAPPEPLVAVMTHDRIARTSGQLPRVDGQIMHPGVVGAEVTVEHAAEAARAAALNGLSALDAALPDGLDGIERVVFVTVFVTSAPGFTDQPIVADAASAVMVEAFGPDRGRHARSAIGVAALPRGACVEVEITVALRKRARGDGAI